MGLGEHPDVGVDPLELGCSALIQDRPAPGSNVPGPGRRPATYCPDAAERCGRETPPDEWSDGSECDERSRLIAIDDKVAEFVSEVPDVVERHPRVLVMVIAPAPAAGPCTTVCLQAHNGASDERASHHGRQ